MLKSLLLSLVLVAIFAPSRGFAQATSRGHAQMQTISFNEDSDEASSAAQYEAAMKAIQARRDVPNESHSVEVAIAPAAPIFQIDFGTTAKIAEPHGDFYILTGNLEDGWTDDDYKDLYPVVKWLSKKGFRVIVNPIAFAADLREAVQNPKTAGILWNGHGSKDGVIWDADNKPLPADIFLKSKSAQFKYTFFANCWGKFSGQYYGLAKAPSMFVKGWDRETTSEDMFDYLMGDQFKPDLEKALGTSITEKSHDNDDL